MTAYIVIASLLVVVALFLLYLEIGDRLFQRELEPLTNDEAIEHLYPLGNVDVVDKNGAGP